MFMQPAEYYRDLVADRPIEFKSVEQLDQETLDYIMATARQAALHGLNSIIVPYPRQEIIDILLEQDFELEHTYDDHLVIYW